ncbi:MAG: glycosyltransferase family 39 protein [Candidatus Omnitrophica bacterium]|nr:glycosyltransferase family 39 protein [Candidatus Omnitrophota bacterium]
MSYIRPQKTICFLAVLALAFGSFIINQSAFNTDDDYRSFDEVVYWQLGLGLKERPLKYNSHSAAELISLNSSIEKEKLPDYFTAPLFKHPPFFPFLTSLSMRLFGDDIQVARYVSQLMGALLILMTYLLAKDLFGYNVGVLSAAFVYLDPVINMCSQKIWMDTTLAFLTLLSLYLFVRALKTENTWFFISSGMVAGLALNTKYTGGLVLMTFVIYSFFWKRDLFANRYFIFSLFLPLIMLFPWLCLNYRVYGFSSVTGHEELQIFLKQIYPFMVSGIIGSALICYVYLFLKRKKWFDNLKHVRKDLCSNQTVQKIFKLCLGLSMLIVLKDYLMGSLDFFHQPKTSLVHSFIYEPPIFYFGRLLEYSFIFAFAYLALFSGFHKKNVYGVPLKITIALILLFFSAWGYFQCRYILAAVPLLIILGVACWSHFLKDLHKVNSPIIAFSSRLMLRLTLIYIILRAIFLNFNLTYSKSVCYF